MSLRGILLLIVAAIVLTGLGIVLASSVAGGNGSWQVGQVHQEIQAIDTRIGDEVISFFYLSQADPCSYDTLQKISTANNLDIQTSLTTERGLDDCVWKYKDVKSGQIIAKDFWRRADSQLKMRDYYRDSTVIAQDYFDQQSSDCFKRRVYLNDQGQVIFEECYSEAGTLRTRESHNTLISPIPPMVYWFFYR